MDIVTYVWNIINEMISFPCLESSKFSILDIFVLLRKHFYRDINCNKISRLEYSIHIPSYIMHGLNRNSPLLNHTSSAVNKKARQLPLPGLTDRQAISPSH